VSTATLVVEVVPGQCPLPDRMWSRDCTAGAGGGPCAKCGMYAADADATKARAGRIMQERLRTREHYRQWIYTWGLPRLLGVPAAVYVPLFLLCMALGALTAQPLFTWVWGQVWPWA
jgi:hypothetical protein